MKKFKLTKETKIEYGVTFYRIETVSDIPYLRIKKGVKGGWLEKESNLAHGGNAWVGENARVRGNARVGGNAAVGGNAVVEGDAVVRGNAAVGGNAVVDSLSAIIVFIIAAKWSITVTKNLVFIGCKQFTRNQILKTTKKQALKMGLPATYYQAYREMIKGAFRIVK